jgi:hypothetical protein
VPISVWSAIMAKQDRAAAKGLIKRIDHLRQHHPGAMVGDYEEDKEEARVTPCQSHFAAS